MYLQYLPMHCTRTCVWGSEWMCRCVCVRLSGGCSDGGSPSHVPAFRPKPGRFPPPKINVCESICAPVCVCQGFVRQISPACAALVLLNQASITRPLWIMQGRLLLTYSTGCLHVCVRVCVTGWSFFPLANATGQFFDVPPLGPLNLVSDTGTPTLILSLRVCAPHVCVCVRARACMLEAPTVDGKSLTQADSSGLHFDTPWLITYSRHTVEYCH